VAEGASVNRSRFIAPLYPIGKNGRARVISSDAVTSQTTDGVGATQRAAVLPRAPPL
jgi:hypothetical protein